MSAKEQEQKQEQDPFFASLVAKYQGKTTITLSQQTYDAMLEAGYEWFFKDKKIIIMQAPLSDADKSRPETEGPNYGK